VRRPDLGKHYRVQRPGSYAECLVQLSAFPRSAARFWRVNVITGNIRLCRIDPDYSAVRMSFRSIGPTPEKSNPAMRAMLAMDKFDIRAL
jgi:hypothetical protein